MTGSNSFTGCRTCCMTDALSDSITNGLSNGIGYGRRNTASYRIGDTVCLGVGMVPPFRRTEVRHIHHWDRQAEVHARTSLQLLVPPSHLTGGLSKPSLEMLGFYGTRYDLKNIFSVGHTGDIFLSRVLGIGIDVLTAHALVTHINTTGFRFGNSSNNGEPVHRVHLFVEPFELIIG